MKQGLSNREEIQNNGNLARKILKKMDSNN